MISHAKSISGINIGIEDDFTKKRSKLQKTFEIMLRGQKPAFFQKYTFF